MTYNISIELSSIYSSTTELILKTSGKIEIIIFLQIFGSIEDTTNCVIQKIKKI